MKQQQENAALQQLADEQAETLRQEYETVQKQLQQVRDQQMKLEQWADIDWKHTKLYFSQQSKCIQEQHEQLVQEKDESMIRLSGIKIHMIEVAQEQAKLRRLGQNIALELLRQQQKPQQSPRQEPAQPVGTEPAAVAVASEGHCGVSLDN